VFLFPLQSEHELGIDLLEPMDVRHLRGAHRRAYGRIPLTTVRVATPSLYGKVGLPEGAFFACIRSVAIGMFDVGLLQTEVHELDIVELIAGKTFRFCVGYTLEALGGMPFRPSYMNAEISLTVSIITAGWSRGPSVFYLTGERRGGNYTPRSAFHDYASVRNFIGGGVVGVAYYFFKGRLSPTVPVWFHLPRSTAWEMVDSESIAHPYKLLSETMKEELKK